MARSQKFAKSTASNVIANRMLKADKAAPILGTFKAQYWLDSKNAMAMQKLANAYREREGYSVNESFSRVENDQGDLRGVRCYLLIRYEG